MRKHFLRIFLPILLILTLATTLSVIALATADDTSEYPDAMVDILADTELAAYKIDEKSVANDGYLGIGVDFTMYYDADNFTIEHGTNGTKLIMYVVNTHAERTGTDSDVSIIKSMISRGYLVAVADYHNHEKAVSPDLEWSTQTVMRSLLSGSYFTNATIAGSYKETFIVPSGHNISTDHVFWQFDRHAVDGTLEKIVEVWNYDFRGMKGDCIIPWVYEDGTRKATQNGIHDDSAPVWYSLGTGDGQVTYNGQTFVPDENGTYIKVKHTLAEKITDCVNKDGSPIDLNLYLHIIYPTNPEKTVPTLTLASSSEHLASGSVSDGRPHTYGFAFNGYAVAMYDYAYVPMARVDHYSYFDGSSMDSGSVTGDNFTYSLFTYNSSYVPTAAMRYIRYLALTEPETYALNGKIGVIGNSKGSMMTHLADLDYGLVKTTADGYTEEELEEFAYEYITSFEQYYHLYGHAGETRYDMGYETYTENGVTIDGGEIQPWLTYNGAMIPSGAQFVYSSCGGMSAEIDSNFAPFMTTAHIGIESTGYSGNNQIINIARYHDVPFLGFELYLGHTFLQRESNDLGIDPYVAYKNFVHYVLDDRAITVAYALPLADSVISVNEAFTIHFTGLVSASEIAKVTLTDKDGGAVVGVWESAYGRTEWTFTPSASLKAGTEYTLTVPSTLLGENGKAIAESFTRTYHTEEGDVTSLGLTETKVSNTNGATVIMTVPDLTAYAESGVNRAEISVSVTDDAANSLSFYIGDANGTLLGTVPVDGVGNYSLDITNALAAMTAGEEVTIFIKASKSANFTYPTDSKLTAEDFEDGAYTFNVGSRVTSKIVEMDGHGKVYSAYITHTTSAYEEVHKYYPNTATVLQYNKVVPTASLTDIGRTYIFTFDVYDTITRDICVSVSSLSNKTTGVTDYHVDRLNTSTKAGEWVTVTFEFSIQDPLYGKSGLNGKNLSISAMSDGSAESKIYFDNLSLKEVTTEATISSVSLVLTNAGGTPYKEGTSENPWLVGETSYATFAEAVAALGTASGTITLQNNVTLTDTTLITGMKAESVVLDLNGYEIRTNITSYPLVAPSASANTSVTIKNGSIYLSGGALVGFTKAASNMDFSLTLNSVHIGTEKGANTTELLVDTVNAGKGGNVALTLNNCSVDMREGRFTLNPVIMFPDETASVTSSLTVAGGSVTMSRTDEKLLFNSIKNVFFKKYNDAYTTFYLASVREIGDLTVISEDGFASVVENTAITAPDGYKAYSPIASALSTIYGIIPDAYASVEDYPFVVFDMDTYTFLAASAEFIKDSGDAIINKINSTDGNFAIFMRRNFEHTNSSYNLGACRANVVIDLGGYTLTYTKGISAQSKYVNTVTTIKFQNGTLKSNCTAPFITYSLLDNNKENDFHFTFENITFSLTSGVTPTYWVSKAGNSSTGGAFINTVTVKDCTFDLENLSSATTLFGLGHNSGLIRDTVTLIGSDFKGDPTNVALRTLFGTENREFILERGEDGNYITNTRLTTAETPSCTVVTPEGAMYFAKVLSTNGDYTTYSLEIHPLATPYGMIPEEYAADPETYAILLFNSDTGEVIWAGNQWGGETSADKGTVGGALEQLRKNCSKGSLAIYLQADIEATAYYNFGCTTGTHIIDLGGHTVTALSSFIQGQAKNMSTTSKLHITVKNGTINLGSQKLVSIGSNTYGEDYRADMTYVFEGVKVTNITSSAYLVHDGLHGDFTTVNNCIFRDCTFELQSRSSTPLFYCGSTSDTKTSASFTVNITVEGGEFIYDSAAIPTFLRTGDMDNKSLIFTKGENGYAKLTTALSSTASNDVAYPTDDGVRYFVAGTSTDTQTSYELCVKTAYGYISPDYANAEEHPILVFQNGKIIASFTKFGDETSDSKGTVGGAFEYMIKSSGRVLYLQADISSTTDYYNFASGSGEYIIDLGGHTVTLTSRFFYSQAKSTKALSVLVKNGTVKVGNNPVVAVGSGTNSSVDVTGKVMTYTFENVHFTDFAASNGTLVSDTMKGLYETTANVIFNECVFDIPSTFNLALLRFGTNQYSPLYNIHVTFNGGEFNYAGKNIATLMSVDDYHNDNKFISFGKGEGGYPVIVAPTTANISTMLYRAEEGLYGLYELAKDTATYTYRITPLSFVSAYMNLTNEMNLVWRAFLPAGYTNPSVTFALGNLTVTVTDYVLDENGLYCFKLPNINPAKLGLTVTATLSAELDGENKTYVCDTLSAKSYLEQLKADYADDSALVDLVDKLLAYGAAAQQYLGQDESEFVTEVGTPEAIPESENILALSGEESTNYAISKCGMTLDGAFALRITVRLASTDGLVLVATKGEKVTTFDLSEYEVENGTVTVFYELYANELGDTVIFALEKDGTAVGKTLCASANAYLYRISTEEGNLATLARAIYAYGKAASAYSAQ